MNPNPIVLSIPIFFILMGVEIVVERLTHRKLYRLPDSIANLSCGITSQLSGIFFKVLAVGVYEVIYTNFALFQLERNWIYWTALFFLVDLGYYWAHRMSHEINLFWGGHVVHHQSEEYNLSVALRQSSFQVVWTFFYYLPLAVVGFNTLDFLLISSLNTLYQFWIHTETINKMGWFEYVFNTPSHHRVHHGRDPKYIDKNHAGTLIIWDKMFGTFQPEEERPTYGITKPVNSWNGVWANFSHYATMASELKLITSWRDKIRYLFNKPGWFPKELGGYRPAPPVVKATYVKYDTPAPVLLSYYTLFQYIICLIATAVFLFNQGSYSMYEKAVVSALISISVMNCGVLFEQKRWVYVAEWLRIILYPAGLITLATIHSWPLTVTLAAAGYLLISVTWYFYLPKSYAKV